MVTGEWLNINSVNRCKSVSNQCFGVSPDTSGLLASLEDGESPLSEIFTAKKTAGPPGLRPSLISEVSVPSVAKKSVLIRVNLCLFSTGLKGPHF